MFKIVETIKTDRKIIPRIYCSELIHVTLRENKIACVALMFYYKKQFTCSLPNLKTNFYFFHFMTSLEFYNFKNRRTWLFFVLIVWISAKVFVVFIKKTDLNFLQRYFNIFTQFCFRKHKTIFVNLRIAFRKQYFMIIVIIKYAV